MRRCYISSYAVINSFEDCVAGSGLIDCPDEPRNLGLWIDALNFIVVTIQIIIFDTQYTEIVTEELNRKVAEAKS